MGKGGKGDGDKKKTKQVACLACTALLVGILILLAILYFAVFQPKDPKIQVPTMQLLSLYPSGYPAATTSVNLTLNLQVSMYNPNRGTFIVEDGGVSCLYYYGSQVGFTPVPTGSIPAQSFSTVSIPLTVQGSAPLRGPNLVGDVQDGILEVTTTVTIMGKVTTLNLFTRHSNVVSKCNVNVSLNARGIMAYTCQKSYTLDP